MWHIIYTLKWDDVSGKVSGLVLKVSEGFVVPKCCICHSQNWLYSCIESTDYKPDIRLSQLCLYCFSCASGTRNAAPLVQDVGRRPGSVSSGSWHHTRFQLVVKSSMFLSQRNRILPAPWIPRLCSSQKAFYLSQMAMFSCFHQLSCYQYACLL